MLRLLNKLFYLRSQKGQSLLIIVLVMVVATTVGLSIVSRTVTNLRTAEDQQNSQKALAAAEAGVEQVMKTNASIPTASFLSGTSYSTTITTAQAPVNSVYVLDGGNAVKKNDGDTVWITPYSSESAKLFISTWAGSQLTIYWGSTSDVCQNNLSNTMAALEVVVLSGSKASPSIKTYGFDPCTSGKAPVSPDRTSSEKFQAPTGSNITVDTNVGRRTFASSAVVPISQGLMVKVMPLYADTLVAVKGDRDLPPQGVFISSLGTSGTTQRKITVFQGYPEIPSEVFPYNLLILPNE